MPATISNDSHVSGLNKWEYVLGSCGPQMPSDVWSMGILPPFQRLSLAPLQPCCHQTQIASFLTPNLLFTQPVTPLSTQHRHSDRKPRSHSRNCSLSHTPISKPIKSEYPEFNRVSLPSLPPPSSAPPFACSNPSIPLPASTLGLLNPFSAEQPGWSRMVTQVMSYPAYYLPCLLAPTGMIKSQLSS